MADCGSLEDVGVLGDHGQMSDATRSVLDDGPFFHGTKVDLQPGDLLAPGYASNFGARAVANYVYLTATLDAATWGAELALGDGPGRIYQVEPTGPFEDDPNLTDAKFPGNPTRSYRTRDPLRVVGEVERWEPHAPDVLQHMRDRVAELAAQGVEAINDLPDDEEPRTFTDANLRGARFVRSDLSGAVLRGVEIAGAEIDSPWLLEGGSTLHVNGVDVAPFVDAELDRRFPGRALRRADDPAGLREAWSALQRTWSSTLERAASLPSGTVEVSVGGEWSFAQTLRHLVMATDVWLRQAVHGVERPYHPIGLPYEEYAADGNDMSVFTTTTPSYDEVLEVRAGRVAMVGDFLATVTVEELATPRANPWAPQHPETTLSCLHTILEEEWEHHRYAVRDLDALAGQPPPAR